MRFVFQAQHGAYTDHAIAADAIADVEAQGSGAIIKFAVEPNPPGCLPAEVYRSHSLWRFKDGKWTKWSIFTGVSEPICTELPN